MKFAHVRVANISHLRSKYFTAKRFHLPARANFVAYLLYGRYAVRGLLLNSLSDVLYLDNVLEGFFKHVSYENDTRGNTYHLSNGEGPPYEVYVSE